MKDDDVSGRLRRSERVDVFLNLFLVLVATFVWSARSAQAALIGHFVHNYGSVVITLDLFDGQPGGKYLWQYTVDNLTFDPNPGTSNGFSGFELFLPSPIAEIADVTPNPGSVPPWDVNCCSGNPVEWDRRNSDGNGVMPAGSMIFSFTTDPRLVAINDDGWFHTWQFDSQTDINPTVGMHVPFVPGLQPPLCGNEVLDPGEECDPPNSPTGAFPCPPESPGGAFVPCNADCTCGTLPIPTTTTPTTTVPATSTTSTTLLNHFQCYEAKRNAIVAGPVTIQDQFGTTSGVQLSKPNRLCAPTNKQNEDPTAPNDPDHLKSWQDKRSGQKFVNQTVVNQFGTIVVDVSRPSFLLVPASKSFTGNPPPLAGPTVDHFQCYKAKRSRGTPKFVKITGVTGVDQFGSYTVDLLKPRYLCAPANKSGEDPTAPSHPEHLLCYKTRNAGPKFTNRTAFATDQFGSQQMELLRRIELCVPSLKNPVPTTTTSTVTPTTTTSSTGPITTTTQAATTSTSVATTSTTSTTLYGSPSRAFMDPVRSLLE